MTHLSSEQRIAYIDDALMLEEAAEVEAHLARCGACARALDAQRRRHEQVADALRARIDAERAPASMRFQPIGRRLRAAWPAAPRRRGRVALAVTALTAAGAVALLVLLGAWLARPDAASTDAAPEASTDPRPQEAPRPTGPLAAPPDVSPREALLATGPLATPLDTGPRPADAPPLWIDGALGDLPAGWRSGGSGGAYRIGTADLGGARGTISLLIYERGPEEGFGQLNQAVSAARYRGQRLRFSGALAPDHVTGAGGLWMRVDSADGRVLAFDNMHARPITGTGPWARHAIVLDVPEDAAQVVFGALLRGAGRLGFDDARLEVVGADVPTTDSPLTAPLDAPINLDFDVPGEP